MSEIENRRWTLSTVDADGNIGSSAIEPLTPDNLVKAIESAIQAASLNGITEFTKSQIAEKEKCTLVN
jgi:hypothetical protein